jgi:hypothetical protein
MSYDNISVIVRQIIVKFELLKQKLYVIRDNTKIYVKKTKTIWSVAQDHYFLATLLLESHETNQLLTQILHSSETLLAVFREWMDRFQTCIDCGGEYVEYKSF